MEPYRRFGRRETMTSVLRGWNDYWFRPTRVVDLALFRVALVGSQLLLFFPSLKPQLSLLGVPGALYTPLPILKLLLEPFGTWGMRPGATLIEVIWALGLISGALALLGILARLSLAVFAYANTILIAHLYSYGQMSHPEAVMVVALWLLVFAPAGASMSIVRLRRRLKSAVSSMHFVPHHLTSSAAPNTSEYALWPLRLMQWFMCIIYLSAGLSKLKYGGMSWLDASTLRYYLVDDGIRRHATIGLIAASHPLLLPALAGFSLAFELSFVLVMFVPVLVWVYIPLGVVMHSGIFAMQDIRFFQFFVIYVAFSETMRRTWPTVRRLVRGAANAAPTSAERWTLIYDGLCPLCTRTMVMIDALDVTGRLGYVDFERDWPGVVTRAPGLTIENARQAIHLVSPGGELYRGYSGFKRLAWLLPPLWPGGLLLAVPGMDRLGEKVYGEVARRRGRIACMHGACGYSNARSTA
jgi:predicted DCC family thiol-disulfide oxidoreductase YuxK